MPGGRKIVKSKFTALVRWSWLNKVSDTWFENQVSLLFVRRLQFGYFALESLYRNGLQISGKKYSQFF